MDVDRPAGSRAPVGDRAYLALALLAGAFLFALAGFYGPPVVWGLAALRARRRRGRVVVRTLAVAAGLSAVLALFVTADAATGFIV